MENSTFSFSQFQKLQNDCELLKQENHSIQKSEAISSPSVNAIANVLAFSKAYSVRPSNTIGHIEQILN